MRAPGPHGAARRARLAGGEHALGHVLVQRRRAAEGADSAPTLLDDLLQPRVAQPPGLNHLDQVEEGDVGADQGQGHALCRRQEERIDCTEAGAEWEEGGKHTQLSYQGQGQASEGRGGGGEQLVGVAGPGRAPRASRLPTSLTTPTGCACVCLCCCCMLTWAGVMCRVL